VTETVTENCQVLFAQQYPNAGSLTR